VATGSATIAPVRGGGLGEVAALVGADDVTLEDDDNVVELCDVQLATTATPIRVRWARRNRRRDTMAAAS
jgi:hypothetical protein